ncbi:MAG TPA: bifunctional ADP-dependent NAD(P)H-hydrate dehydratase/NAD(P)H-hydrate epimerase [Actinomycetales bacterium]|nr:bifunctional ADP-dependent NAD(P)H-hydrate dehydratase/NAD(P)H-hydrate epimerase [Actinomycetales bacterium]
MRAHAVDAVRAAEQAAMADLRDGALMQRAASALASVVVGELRRRTGGVYGRRVVLLVGPGSNGGDASWAGARLAARGVRVDAVLTSGRVHGGGLEALRRAGGRVADAGTARGLLGRADLVVDGILGIGARPGLEGLAADLANDMPPGLPVVAVDLPSGVDPDTGETPVPHVRADTTVTFGTAKPCLLVPPANEAAGRVVVVDIGLDAGRLGPAAVERWEPADAAARWPVPGPDDDKYSRGVLGVVAGGQTYTGAAVLATGGAVAAGVGMVRYLGPPAPTDLVRSRWPEVVPGDGRVQAWVLGPGVDPDDDGQRRAVEAALGSAEPCVVDAGALAVLTGRRAAPTLLTPHAGELARLLSSRGEPVERADVEARPLHHARVAAGLTGATVLLKGATALVVPPEGPVRAQPDGPHWLATAGSGDVLSGIAGVLLAAGLDPLDAGSAAVVVHSLAGHLASRGGPTSASAVLAALPTAVASLLTRPVPALGH